MLEQQLKHSYIYNIYNELLNISYDRHLIKKNIAITKQIIEQIFFYITLEILKN